MCTQIKDVRSLYMKNGAVRQFFTAMMCTQVRFCLRMARYATASQQVMSKQEVFSVTLTATAITTTQRCVVK